MIMLEAKSFMFISLNLLPPKNSILFLFYFDRDVSCQ